MSWTSWLCSAEHVFSKLPEVLLNTDFCLLYLLLKLMWYKTHCLFNSLNDLHSRQLFELLQFMERVSRHMFKSALIGKMHLQSDSKCKSDIQSSLVAGDWFFILFYFYFFCMLLAETHILGISLFKFLHHERDLLLCHSDKCGYLFLSTRKREIMWKKRMASSIITIKLSLTLIQYKWSLCRVGKNDC